MEIRPIEAGDGPALVRFFERIPESDRTFLKEDVGDPQVLEHWVAPGAGRRIAVEDGEVVGSVAVVPLIGWSSHVGEVRLVVDPEPSRTRARAEPGAPGGARRGRHGAAQARRRGDRRPGVR